MAASKLPSLWFILVFILFFNAIDLVSSVMYNKVMVNFSKLLLTTESAQNSVCIESSEIEPLVIQLNKFKRSKTQIINTIDYHLAQLSFCKGDFYHAVEILKSSDKKMRSRLDLWLLGYSLWSAGRESNAVEVWNTTAGVANYFLNRGSEAERQSDYLLAEEYFRILMRLDASKQTGEAGYWFNHTMLLLDELTFDASELDLSFNRAMFLNKDSASRQLQLGIALYSSNKLPQAETVLIQSSELDPSSIWPIYYLGQVHYKLHRYQQAEEKFREIIKMSPDFGRGYHWLARTLVKLDKKDQALIHYQTAVTLLPEDTSLKEEYLKYMKKALEDKNEEE